MSRKPDVRPSLEERVGMAYHRLVLIEAAAAQALHGGFADNDDLLDAISEAAREAAEVLEAVRHAPAKIANWHAAEESKGGAR